MITITIFEMILEELREGPLSRSEILNRVVAKHQASRDSVRRRLLELSYRKWVVNVATTGEPVYELQEESVDEDKPPEGAQPVEGCVLNTDEMEEYIDLVSRQQPILQKVEGIGRSVMIPFDESGWFGIVYGSDWHIGSLWTEHYQLLKEAKIIHETPHLYYMFGGDAGDGGIPGGRHIPIFNEQIMSANMQRKVASYVAGLIGPKLKLVLLGCHDSWTKEAADYDFLKEAARIAGCAYMGGGGKYYIQCAGGVEWCGVYHHKAGGHSQYNPLHPCVRRALFHEQEADIICVGHEHVSASGVDMVGERMRYMARTGAKKRFDRYASRLAADESRINVHIDVPVLILHGSQKRGFWVRGVELGARVLTGMRIQEGDLNVAA